MEERLDLDKLIRQLGLTGIMSSNVSKAVNIINKMISWKLSDQPDADEDDLNRFKNRRTVIYLGFCSSLATGGSRDIIRYLFEHRMISIAVTTAGGIEEDLSKCFEDYSLAQNGVNGADGTSEIQGNMSIPLTSRDKFKAFFKKEIRELHLKQDIPNKIVFGPSKIIKHLGLKINDPTSICYQAAVNNIPLFCPAFTDGFIGQCLYEYGSEYPGFVVDGCEDIF